MGRGAGVYRWYMPLLHLDTHVKFVQYIKLAIQECGLGAEWVRARDCRWREKNGNGCWGSSGEGSRRGRKRR